MATVTVTREFTSRSLHAFRVDRIASAPVLMAEDGSEKSYVILGVHHRPANTELVGWYRVGKEWRDEILETWDEQISDAEALSTAEVLPAPLTIR